MINLRENVYRPRLKTFIKGKKAYGALDVRLMTKSIFTTT